MVEIDPKKRQNRFIKMAVTNDNKHSNGWEAFHTATDEHRNPDSNGAHKHRERGDRLVDEKKAASRAELVQH